MPESPRNTVLVCALSALAGYVDSIGYLYLGGLFVSFMSGNSTRMGVELAKGEFGPAGEAFGLVVLFVVGAGCGSLIVLGQSRYRQSWLLLGEAVLLLFAALCGSLGLAGVGMAAITLAMGMENAMFQVSGGGGLGLTYVTGALVKVGQVLAALLTRGGERFAWVPNLLLWAALVAGSVCGALAYHWIDLAAVWFAAAGALALAAYVAVDVGRRH
jgi:uncharacterized membrane protein YoaK (UPF0700 family)